MRATVRSSCPILLLLLVALSMVILKDNTESERRVPVSRWKPHPALSCQQYVSAWACWFTLQKSLQVVSKYLMLLFLSQTGFAQKIVFVQVHFKIVRKVITI